MSHNTNTSVYVNDTSHKESLNFGGLASSGPQVAIKSVVCVKV